MAENPAFDLDMYVGLPRVSSLHVSPDGRRLVATVAQTGTDGKTFVKSLWAIDPSGERPPRRMTRSAEGEDFAAFLADGSVLFTSSRPDPDAPTDDKGAADRSRLWLLPADGGEARVVAYPPLGVGAAAAALEAKVVAYSSGRWPGSSSVEVDAERAKERRERDIGAQLFERYPIRFWDHYLPTEEPHLFVAATPGGTPADAEGSLADGRDVTPDAGPALHGDDDYVSFVLTPDGATLVSTWRHPPEPRRSMFSLVAIDTANGDRRVLAESPHADFTDPAVSPDGRSVACVRRARGTPDEAPDMTVWLVDLASGDGEDATPGFTGWPHSPAWAPDGGAVLFTADEAGETPVFRVKITGEQRGTVTRLTAEGSHSDIRVAPDGRAAYALRSSLSSPPEVVTIDPSSPDQRGWPLPTPGLPLPVDPPGRVESLRTTADDGAEVQSWLVLPGGASTEAPAPLVVFIHGGPLAAWGNWSWRWNPQLLAHRGYAVLLPNPALSTGFGQAYINRGRGRWGAAPYTDIMAAVDDAEARPDIDECRTAAMGGSFGGYMANWVAGHSDRFRCIVTHASLWAMDQFHGTTDAAVWWEHEFGDPYSDPSRYEANSPNRHVGSISTPMLVIHGELDHRVPIGEGLRLWTDLMLHDVDAKFLYFPDENHWVLKPHNARIWYDTVLAWLDHHVLDRPWERPPLL
ncbi:S9 family peptidase [soil metagenome]